MEAILTQRDGCTRGHHHAASEMKKVEPSTSIQRVLDACTALSNAAQSITADNVVDLTGLKRDKVQYMLKDLKTRGDLQSSTRGLYSLVESHPEARAISLTIAGNGMTKVELGDDMLELTPAEARHIAMLFAGRATEAAVIESSRAHILLATELYAQVEKLKKDIAALRQLQDKRQMALGL